MVTPLSRMSREGSNAEALDLSQIGNSGRSTGPKNPYKARLAQDV
jgi:hypothetical protein